MLEERRGASLVSLVKCRELRIHWSNAESSGSTSGDTVDKCQAGFPCFLHTHSEPFSPKYRSAAHKPDKKDFNAAARNNNKLHHRPYFQRWVSTDASKEGKKLPHSQTLKLCIEEIKLPGFL